MKHHSAGIDAVTSRLEWIEAWGKDATGVMTEVYRRHASAVHLRVRGVCGVDNAADVTQEVFLRLWRNPAAFDPAKGSLGTYLSVLARGVAIDAVRSDSRRRRRDVLAVAGDGPTDALGDRAHHDQMIRTEVRVRVETALAQLDPRHRDAIQSRFYEDISFVEAARREGVAEGTVKSRVRLGLRHMRPALSDLQDGSPEKSLVA